jgi:hypothetical protein
VRNLPGSIEETSTWGITSLQGSVSRTRDRMPLFGYYKNNNAKRLIFYIQESRYDAG